jgi:hypothetical protein
LLVSIFVLAIRPRTLLEPSTLSPDLPYSLAMMMPERKSAENLRNTQVPTA